MSETPNTFSFDTFLAVLNEEFCDPTFNIDDVEKTNELRKIEAEDIAFLGGLPSVSLLKKKKQSLFLKFKRGGYKK